VIEAMLAYRLLPIILLTTNQFVTAHQGRGPLEQVCRAPRRPALWRGCVGRAA
jgi:hypothetical protein